MAPIVRVASEAYLDRLNIFGDVLAEYLFKVATLLSGSLGRKKRETPGNKVDKMQVDKHNWQKVVIITTSLFLLSAGLTLWSQTLAAPKVYTLPLLANVSFAHANANGNSCLSLHVCRKWDADLSSSLGFPNMLRTLWCDNAKLCWNGFLFLLKISLLFVVMLSLFVCLAELDNKATLSDHILTAVLGLLKKEVPEHGRHLQQYFHFFLMYSMIGPPEVCTICLTVSIVPID